MKKLMKALAAVLLLSLVLGILPGTPVHFLTPLAAKALPGGFEIPLPDFPVPDFPMPEDPIFEPVLPDFPLDPLPHISTPIPFIPEPEIPIGPGIPIPLDPHLPTIPIPLPGATTPRPETATPRPETATPRPETATPRPETATPRPDRSTPRPDRSTPKPGIGGQYITSEGPLFLSFRQDLTVEPFMFTPMDLSVDAEYQFPLVGSASQVVGEAKVMVRSGMVIVTYLVVNGVQVDADEEFFTFFRDIRTIPSVYPSQLQHVKLQFGMPYSVAAWLNSDPNVLLYINCPASYKTNLAGLMPFSFQDPAYLERMMALLPLMD